MAPKELLIDWLISGDLSVEFLYDLLKYSHMIGMSNLVDQSVEKLSLYFERPNWEDNASQNMNELVIRVTLSAQLSLKDLHHKLSDILMNKLVKGRLKDGANPLVQVCPNGKTILHVINEKIRSTNDMEHILSDRCLSGICACA